MEGWVLFTILAILFWGVSMFLPKLAVRTLPPFHLIVYSTAFYFAATLVLLAFYDFNLVFHPRGALIGVVAGMVGMAGQLSYVYAIRNRSLAFGIVVTSLYPAVSALLAFLILEERLALQQMAGILLAVVSLILVAGAGERKVRDTEKKNGSMVPALLALALWGVWAFLPKLAMQSLPPQSVIFYAAIGNALVAIPVWVSLRSTGGLAHDKRGMIFAAGGSIISLFATLAYFYALKLGSSVATVATLAAMYPVIVLVLARIFLHERMNRTQFFGGGMALMAVVLLVK